MKDREQKKGIAVNTLYTMGGLLWMNAVLQIVVTPLLNRLMGAEQLGNLLYITGLVAIICPSVGQALNTSRLVVRRDCEVTNGDYDWLLLIFGAIGSFVALVMSRNSITNMAMAVGVFIMFMLTVFRYYGDVEYRLNLNYRRYFIYYLLIGIGYLAGFGIYYVTGQWVWIYLIGEGAALIFVGITGKVFYNFWNRSRFFSAALSRGFFLMLSYLVTNTTLNIDRLVIRQVLGNEQVTWYYVTSLIGKTLVLLIAPINTIVISYLTKRKERLTRLQYGKAALAGGIVSFVFFLACQVGTPLFVWLFYRNLYDSVKGIVTVVNLAQILGLYSAFLFILVLTFTDERWQLGLQLAHFGILLAVSIPAAKMCGLTGFAYASLGANILRVAAVIILGLVKAQKGKESKDEYR